MFEFLIGILVMAAIAYTGFDIINRIYTRETATDLDKWEADHADILTSKLILKEWSALWNDYTGNEITALVNYIHYGNGDFGLAEGYCVIGLTDIFCVFGK